MSTLSAAVAPAKEEKRGGHSSETVQVTVLSDAHVPPPRQRVKRAGSWAGSVPLVLFIGATGDLGRPVLESLIEDSELRVRCLVRDVERARNGTTRSGVLNTRCQAHVIKGLADVESDECTLVQGDITNEESIRRALPGVTTVLVCVGARSAKVNGATVHQRPVDIEGPGMTNVVNAIKACNSAASIALVSCWGVNRPNDTWKQMWDAWSGGAYIEKLQAEKVLRQSKIAYIIIRLARLGADNHQGKLAHTVLNQHHGTKFYPPINRASAGVAIANATAFLCSKRRLSRRPSRANLGIPTLSNEEIGGSCSDGGGVSPSPTTSTRSLDSPASSPASSPALSPATVSPAHADTDGVQSLDGPAEQMTGVTQTLKVDTEEVNKVGGPSTEIIRMDASHKLGFSNTNDSCVVTRVMPGGQAEKAGMKVKWRISAVDGKPITTDEDLTRELDLIRHMEDQAFELTMVDQGGFGLGHTSPNGVRAAAREKRKVGRQIQITFDLYGCDEDSMMGSAIFDRKQTVVPSGGHWTTKHFDAFFEKAEFDADGALRRYDHDAEFRKHASGVFRMRVLLWLFCGLACLFPFK